MLSSENFGYEPPDSSDVDARAPASGIRTVGDVSLTEIDSALDFPRWLFRQRLPLVSTCPHATNYDDCDAQCSSCTHRAACEWLHHFDQVAPWPTQSTTSFRGALEYAISEASKLLDRRAHDSARCLCTACRWLRDARELTRRLSQSRSVRETRRLLRAMNAG